MLAVHHSRCFMRSLGSGLRAVAPRAGKHSLSRRVQVRVAQYSDEAVAASAPRIFAEFGVYKGKTAAQFKPIPPTMDLVQGNGTAGYEVSKPGVLLLEMAPLAGGQGGQSSYGARSYDWANAKITFAISALELAQLIEVDAPGARPVSLTHDTTKIKSTGAAAGAAAGQTPYKKLNFTIAQDGVTYMLNLSQGPKNYTCPLTRAELVVLKHLAAYLIPRFYGFDVVFGSAAQ